MDLFFSSFEGLSGLNSGFFSGSFFTSGFFSGSFLASGSFFSTGFSVFSAGADHAFAPRNHKSLCLVIRISLVS
jgi:hypothetical protein